MTTYTDFLPNPYCKKISIPTISHTSLIYHNPTNPTNPPNPTNPTNPTNPIYPINLPNLPNPCAISVMLDYRPKPIKKIKLYGIAKITVSNEDVKKLSEGNLIKKISWENKCDISVITSPTKKKNYIFIAGLQNRIFDSTKFICDIIGKKNNSSWFYIRQTEYNKIFSSGYKNANKYLESFRIFTDHDELKIDIKSKSTNKYNCFDFNNKYPQKTPEVKNNVDLDKFNEPDESTKLNESEDIDEYYDIYDPFESINYENPSDFSML